MTWADLFIGIIAGVVSAVVRGIFRKVIHPRVDIWDFAIYDKTSKKIIVNIVNKSRSRVTGGSAFAPALFGTLESNRKSEDGNQYFLWIIFQRNIG